MTEEEFEFDLNKFRWQAEFARKLDGMDFTDPEAVEAVLRGNTAMLVDAGTHLERVIGQVNELSELVSFIDWYLDRRANLPWWKRMFT